MKPSRRDAESEWRKSGSALWLIVPFGKLEPGRLSSKLLLKNNCIIVGDIPCGEKQGGAWDGLRSLLQLGKRGAFCEFFAISSAEFAPP